MLEYIGAIVVILGLIVFFAGIRIVRPTHRGLVERLGRYNHFAHSGFNWIIPIIDRIVQINTTEQMVDAKSQEIITSDNLNATVDAQVYFKVRKDEESVKNSQYNVDDYEWQIVNLSRTTLRNIIGKMSLKECNSERGKINESLMKTLAKETHNWGIEVVRTELKEIKPPQDVQETMNKVVKASNEKISAIDYATSVETQADGEKRAEIKKAEGFKQSEILKAEGQAQAIKLVNESAELYFKGNALKLKQLEVTQIALAGNSKIILPSGEKLVNVIGNLAGV